MPRALMLMRPGFFYDLELGYILPLIQVREGSEIRIGEQVPAACMFEIFNAYVGDQRCGYVFNSKFETENAGGYLVTFLSSGRGRAEKVEVVVKHENLLLYNFPNRGSLAISPLVNEEILSIFEGQ